MPEDITKIIISTIFVTNKKKEKFIIPKNVFILSLNCEHKTTSIFQQDKIFDLLRKTVKQFMLNYLCLKML